MNDQNSSIETNAVTDQVTASTTQSTEPALRNPKSRRVRNGKIARLPLELRDIVSHELYRGQTHDQIAKDLREDGYPDMTRQNIGAWARGGYQDWLKTHQDFNSISLKTEALEQYPYHSTTDALKVNKLNNFMLATRMHQVIEHLDPKELARLVAADPDIFFRFIKEEFNRQQQERELDYKIEDRKYELRRREQFRQEVEFMMIPEAKRPAYFEAKKAELDALKQELSDLQQKQRGGQN